MTVQAILKFKGHEVVTISVEVTLSDAIERLSKHSVGAILVVKDQFIEGILSERDIIRVLARRGPTILHEPVHAAMTREVEVCKPSDTASAVMTRMTNGRFRHLPVVEQNSVVGMISIGDIVKWRVSEYEHEQDVLRNYIKTA